MLPSVALIHVLSAGTSGLTSKFSGFNKRKRANLVDNKLSVAISAGVGENTLQCHNIMVPYF